MTRGSFLKIGIDNIVLIAIKYAIMNEPASLKWASYDILEDRLFFLDLL